MVWRELWNEVDGALLFHFGFSTGRMDWLLLGAQSHHNIVFGDERCVSSFKLTPNAPVQEKHDSLGWDDQESLLV